jgi:hypothetical protein
MMLLVQRTDLCLMRTVLQTVAHARMEQQLYGSSNRTREDDSRVITGKQRSLGGAGGRWQNAEQQFTAGVHYA